MGYISYKSYYSSINSYNKNKKNNYIEQKCPKWQKCSMKR